MARRFVFVADLRTAVDIPFGGYAVSAVVCFQVIAGVSFLECVRCQHRLRSMERLKQLMEVDDGQHACDGVGKGEAERKRRLALMLKNAQHRTLRRCIAQSTRMTGGAEQHIQTWSRCRWHSQGQRSKRTVGGNFGEEA